MSFITQGKTNLKYILIVVVLAAIAGGGILAYQYWWVPKHETTPPEVKNIQKPVGCTQEAKVCPDGSAVGRTGPNCEFAQCPNVKDETANWKTYRNEKYGFEVRYPSEWIITGEGREPKVSLEYYVAFADERETEIIKERQAGEIRCAGGIFLYNNEKGLSLYDWAINKWGNPEKIEAGKISEVKINTLEGIKYEFMSMGTETNVLFSKNNEVINIQTTFDGCDNLHAIFNQILSTFKFLD